VSGGRAPRGYIAAGEGGFTQAMGDGTRAVLDVAEGQAGELRSLLGLRDAAREYLGAGVDGGRDAGAALGELSRRYDAHVAVHGPVNRLDGPAPDGLPAHGGFRGDPYAPLVYALEHVDPDSGQISRSGIFTWQAPGPDPDAGIEPG
jgi:hypothetical protein